MEISPYRGSSELVLKMSTSNMEMFVDVGIFCLATIRYYEGMDDFGFIHQWMSSSDEFNSIPVFAEDFQQSFSHTTINQKRSMAEVVRPAKQSKTNSWDSCITDQLSNPQDISSSSVLSFDNSDYTNQLAFLKPKEEAQVVSSKNYSTLPTNIFKSEGSFENQTYGLKAYHAGHKINVGNRSSQSQDHIIAERKRREKLSQRFIALSAIVPGLKKTDKASVLGDAIKHMKHLQEQVKTLEEKTRKRIVKTAVYMKKSHLFSHSDNSSNDEDFSENSFDEALPEIEARFSGKDVLVRIHCERKKGLMENVVSKIEKLHLIIVNTNVVSFGSYALDITVVAQMDKEFSMTVKDLVKTIRSDLQNII